MSLNVKLNFYPTLNAQYLYDSDLHPEYFDQELLHQYDARESKWFHSLLNEVYSLLEEHNVSLHTAVHFGASMGRIGFQLATKFSQVNLFDSFKKIF